MGRFRNRGISDLKEKGNAECAVQWSVTGMIIMQLPVGLLPHRDNTSTLLTITAIFGFRSWFHFRGLFLYNFCWNVCVFFTEY